MPDPIETQEAKAEGTDLYSSSDIDVSKDSGLLDGLKSFRKKRGEDHDEDGSDETVDEENQDEAEESEEKSLFDPDDIFASLDEFKDEEDEEEDSTDEEEKKPDDVVDEHDEELLTDEGKPISAKAKEAFKALKQDKKDLEDQLTEVRSGNDEALKKIQEENKELKKQLDILDFRSSEDFTNQYEAPVKKAIEEAVRWISTIPEENHADARKALANAQSALASGNESRFFEAVDLVNEDYLTGSRGTRFVGAMNKLWDANESKIKAEKDLESAREGIAQTRQKHVQSSAKIIEASIAAAKDSFEKSNKAVLDFYRRDTVRDKFQIDQVLEDAPKQTNKLLHDFLSTGRVSDELSSILFSGAMSGVRDKERTVLLGSIQNFQTQLTEVQRQLDESTGKLKKVSTKRGSLQNSSESKDDDEEDDDGEYGLLSSIRKMKRG